MQVCPDEKRHAAPLRMKRGFFIKLVVASLLVALLFCAPAVFAQEEWDDRVAANNEIYPLIDEAKLKPHIDYLAGLQSRVAGYPGNEAAAKYVAEQFAKIGLLDVSKPTGSQTLENKPRFMEEFSVAVPVVKHASIEVAGEDKVRLFPLWPNGARTSKLPEGGVDLPLIYGGRGSLAEFNGRQVKGSAVLMEFDTGGDWLNAPRLGAKAVIFIAPKQANSGAERGEAENKFLEIPVDIPRFWISREEAWPLLARIKSQEVVTAHLECDMAWEERPSWNVIGEIPGTDEKLKAQTIYLEAYFDSMSIVPELAPGAEAACGIATMIELAKIYKAHPPARTVRFLATGAHFMGLAGIRAYLSQHFEEISKGERLQKQKFLGFIPYTPRAEKQKINYFCAVDLSSHSTRFGIFYKGMYYDFAEEALTGDFADFARICRENYEMIAGENPEAWDGFADGVNPIAGKPWRTFIVGKVALDNEPVTMAGGKGVCFLTTDDSRRLVDTPFDTVEEVNLANLARQGRLLSCIVREILNYPWMSIPEDSNFARLTLDGGFSKLSGRAVQFEPQEGIVPNKVIPGTVVIMRTTNMTLMGVRADMVDIVDEKGWFEFEGVANVNAYHEPRMTFLEAYHVDPKTGDIDYAPDQGSEGGKYDGSGSYPIGFQLTKGQTERTIVIFPCVPISIYDLVDPHKLTTLSMMIVLDGESDAEPRSYGYTIPWRQTGPNAETMSRIEDVALVFARQDSRIKVIMGMSTKDVSFLLLNGETITEDQPLGLGYAATEAMAIENTPLAVAKDMYALDHQRIEKLARYKIVNENVMDHHRLAKEYIARAEETLASQDYVAMNALARAAWGYEARAYPGVKATNNDIIVAVIFYLFLMLPFSYFMERLIVAGPDLKRQILGIVVIFAITVAVFSRIHPAFRITTNPMIVPLAFIMLSLSVVVISLVLMKFEAQLRALQQEMGGVHRADIGRLGVASAAFGLGISNMRKRRARTLFTCITLVALTFTVLSLTSVVTKTKFNVRRSPGVPRYQGVMIRSANWEPLEDAAYRIIDDEFGQTRAVAPRAWFFSSKTDEQSYITISSNKSDRTYNSRALVGMEPEEAEVTGIDKAMQWGRWFREEDRNACIITTAVAKTFNIGPKDVGRAKIYVGGVPFELAGVMDTSLAMSILDLDQERVTPVDFLQMLRVSAAGGGGGGGRGFRQYVHLSPDDVVFIPYETALNMGAQVESIAVSFANAEEVQETLDQLMPRLGFNIYAGRGREIHRWSSIQRTSVGGFQGLVIPIIIAALIVLNTMLGSVYERVREIHIFSSLGLGPNHIGTLFMAEAIVYAVLGAVFGYLVGQSTSIIITRFDLVGGLSLNYSSVSAVVSTLVVILTVILSTIYPARKASQVATPAVERRWQLPAPEGDRLNITLPFAVTGGQASAMNVFMREWFNGYAEYSVGDFVTEKVEMCRESGEHGEGYCISFMTWLAPFDLGVSQRTELRTVATDMEDVFEIKMTLYRESGDVSSWLRVNRRFLNTLRRQFLIWRTLSAQERDRYLGMAEGMEGAAQPAT